MSEELNLIARFDLQEGKLGRLKELYQIGIDDINENEPDVLYFNLYVSPDERTFCSVETYKDSEAVLRHFELSKERIGEILAISTVTSVEIFGPASQELRDLLSQYGTIFYDFTLGLQRAK